MSEAIIPSRHVEPYWTNLISREDSFLPPSECHFVIRAFLDDSGKEDDPQSSFVCIGGYLAADAHWDIFVKEWGHQLLKHGIAWVHMKDLVPRWGEYRDLGWDEAKRNEALTDFVRVIRLSQLVGFGVAVDADVWRKDVPKALKTIHGDAQQFCFSRILRMVADRIKISRPHDLVSVHCDCDDKFVTRRFRQFMAVRKADAEMRTYLAAITFANPKQYLPLQAADVLAWATRRHTLALLQQSESLLAHVEPLGELPSWAVEVWREKDIKEKLVGPFHEHAKIPQ